MKGKRTVPCLNRFERRLVHKHRLPTHWARTLNQLREAHR
jgi:hypothetical protein